MAKNELTVIIEKARLKHNSKALVLVPTYNEKENIAELLERLVRDVHSAIEILVIDDNSPDETANIVRLLMDQNENIHLLCRLKKDGLGSAYLDGFNIGIEAGFEYLITMDADLSHDPIVINKMLKEIDDNQVVIGSRFVRGGGIVDIQLSRIIISKMGNFATDTLLGMPFHDCTSGFRCYRSEVLRAIDLRNIIKARKYVFLVELLFYLHSKKVSIKEIPIIFINRLKGKTKVDMSEMVHAFLTILSMLGQKYYLMLTSLFSGNSSR